MRAGISAQSFPATYSPESGQPSSRTAYVERELSSQESARPVAPVVPSTVRLPAGRGMAGRPNPSAACRLGASDRTQNSQISAARPGRLDDPLADQNGGSSVRPLRRMATLRDRWCSPARLVRGVQGQSEPTTTPSG
jgi:hypothetical protein